MTRGEPMFPRGVRLRARIHRLRPVVIDVALVVVVGVAISITISAASEPNTRDPDAVAYGLGLLMATLLFGRRRWPLGVFLGTAAILTVYYWMNYPGFVPAVPLAVPLYSAAVAGRFIVASSVSLLWVIGPLLYRLFADPEPVPQVINDSLRDGAFFASIVLLGVAVQ